MPFASILWYLWLLLLGGSLLIDAQLIPDSAGIKTWLRLSSSLVLVLAALVTARQTASPWKWIAWLVATGMLFGFLGDAAMANQLRILPERVLSGMLCFAIGHLAYIAASELTRRQLKLAFSRTWLTAVLAWQVIGIAIWYGVVFLSDSKPALHYPALGYCLLLALTAGMTSGLTLQHRSSWWIALGAALFLASDAILAWQLFRGGGPVIGLLVWATYGPGQMLIVYGFRRLLLRST
jgi:uncharacterized membrane protein YhhN